MGRKYIFEFLLCDSYWVDNIYGYCFIIFIIILGDFIGEKIVI